MKDLLNLHLVYEMYNILASVFRKSQIPSLPLHKTASQYDSQEHPSFTVNFTHPENVAREKHIKGFQAAFILWPSFSFVGCDFFFVGKKDGSLRPCIHFQRLNSTTLKNECP